MGISPRLKTKPWHNLLKACPQAFTGTRRVQSVDPLDTLDLDRESGCIRSVEHAYSAKGGLAVLSATCPGNGCVRETAGVDEDPRV